MHDRLWWAQRAGFWLWLLGSGLCAAAVLGLIAGESRGAGLHVLGAIFAFVVAGYAALGGRIGPGAAVLAVWAMGFGLWFPAWVEALGPVTRHWLAVAGAANPGLVSRLPVPVAIASAGATTAVLMHLMTASGRVFVQTVLLSLIVAATPLLPVHEEGAVMGGIVAWHVAVYGSLYRWMVERVRSGAGLACAWCGLDLVGISSPVCPGCGRSLLRGAAVSGPSRSRARARQAAGPSARWY